MIIGRNIENNILFISRRIDDDDMMKYEMRYKKKKKSGYEKNMKER